MVAPTRHFAAISSFSTQRGGQAVDTAAVAAALPERTSGSDIREVVRRAVLASDEGSVSTATLLAELGSGRYRAEVPAGMYL